MEPTKHSVEFTPLAASPDNVELASLRERVTELDRFAIIGQLTAGIIHEIKNPLTFIINFTRLSIELIQEVEALLDTLKPQTDTNELTQLVLTLTTNLVRIRENGARAERIIQGVLAQTHTSAVAFELTHLNELLEEFTKLAYQGTRTGDNECAVSLQFELDPAIDKVLIAPYAFNRVILNLVLNACYAVQERAKKQPTDYKPTIVVLSQKWPDRVEVKIHDNGDGIPDSIRRQVFTPFFTTKPAGKGTGLGLSLSLDIIAGLHKGSLHVDSEPGHFTEFTICLPLD